MHHHRRFFLPLFLLGLGLLAVVPLREQLTAQAIAVRSPGGTAAAAAFLVLLYGLKSLSVAFPMSALTAAGGLLFPFPTALAVNLVGVAAAQTLPWLVGRRSQGDLRQAAGALALSRPGGQRRLEAHFPAAAGRRQSGDVVSWYLGAAGVPWGRYLSAGLAGSLPRVAAAHAAGHLFVGPRLLPVLSLPGAGRRDERAGRGAVADLALIRAAGCQRRSGTGRAGPLCSCAP